MRQGSVALIPILHFRRGRRRKWQQLAELTFPGHVFAGLEPGSDDMVPMPSTQECRYLVRLVSSPRLSPNKSYRFSDYVRTLRYRQMMN